MTTPPVVIIGAGIGGLSAALDLAGQGVAVTLIEKETGPGGKMRQLSAGGAAMDAGPTVFTMRHVFETLFERAGARLDAHVTLQPLDILARHAWADGSRLDLFADAEQSAQAIAAFAGPDEAERFRRFADETRSIYTMLDASFMRAQKPGLFGLARNLFGEGLRNPLDLMRMRPFETMWSALGRSFTDPRLCQLFGRYATYCGSSPFEAPATLMLIAHAEQAGVWSVNGGMHALARAICDLAKSRGADIRFGARAARIKAGSGGVEGVVLASGEVLPASAVIFNGDYAALGAGLLGLELASSVPATQTRRRSLSAIVSCRLAATSGFPLIRHNVFFSSDYASEFRRIFGQGHLPEEPTVYICAQDRGDSGLAGDREPASAARPERLLCLINAPANGDGASFSETEIASCEDRAARLMERCGLMLHAGPVAQTTPAGFNALFPATGGGLYGQASHGWQASFKRPGARTRLPGLYLAGGSVHPGPGVPMAAMSGMLAAQSLLADRTSQQPLRQAAIAGGMSMR
jgi:1-hydroxycarotenoid 3,4-desaturase